MPKYESGYMQEPWFAVLQAACAGRKQASVARQLGISTGAISQVLNGTGKYGQGSALTKHIAQKVMHVFDRFECPYLTGESSEGAVVINSKQCQAYACRHRIGGTGTWLKSGWSVRLHAGCKVWSHCV